MTDAPGSTDTAPAGDRIEVARILRADAATIFTVLCDPEGHVDIDSSGMLMERHRRPRRRPWATSSWSTWTARRSTTTRSASTT